MRNWCWISLLLATVVQAQRPLMGIASDQPLGRASPRTDDSRALETPPEAICPSAAPKKSQALARIHASTIQGTVDSLLLKGDVRVSCGECLFKAPAALLKGALVPQGVFEELECPELQMEWLDAKGKLCRLECSGPCQLLLREGRAHFTAVEGERIEWSDEDSCIECCRATLRLQLPQWRPQRLHLQGDVRMRRMYAPDRHAPSQCWAEDADVLLDEKVIILEAQPPSSVMLWNRAASQEMACRRLRIWKDPMTQEWMQEAEGGVKVTLTGDVVHQVARSYHDRTSDEAGDEDEDADF